MSIPQSLWYGRNALVWVVLFLATMSPIASEATGRTPRLNRPLGEVRGTSPAQVSFDGRTWISLGSGALLVFDGTLIKARTGTFALILLDGSRLEASPTTDLAIAVMGSSTNVRMTEGSVLFRLRPSSSTRLSLPGRIIQAAAVRMRRAGPTLATDLGARSQAQRDASGMITVQKGGIPRVRLLSGEVVLISQNGVVQERLSEGQARPILAQSSGLAPRQPYAATQPAALPPPTDPPSQAPKAEHVWTWHSAHPQDVRGGWREMRLGVPPPSAPPDQELRQGFAYAWTDRWVIAKRECSQLAALRRPTGGAVAALPPPTDPPSQAPKAEHVWAWHSSNPPQVWGGWQEAKLGPPPATPPPPDQELYEGFIWAWEEPAKRWVVVEECGLAAAFLAPAGPGLGAILGVGAAAAIPAAVLTGGGGSTPTASPVSP